MAKQISYKIIPLCLGVLAISFLLSYVVLAWTEPTMSPPGGNVAPPLRLISGAASLSDLTHSEGNLTNVNAVIGYNDLFLKGNSAETASVYLAGNEIKMYTSGSERMKIDSSGNISIDGNTRIEGNLIAAGSEIEFLGCEGYLSSDNCNGCAGGEVCWFKGGYGQSCDEVCEGHGGCIQADWNDDTNCSVLKHFFSCASCEERSYSEMPDRSRINEGVCGYRSASVSKDCSQHSDIFAAPICACKSPRIRVKRDLLGEGKIEIEGDLELSGGVKVGFQNICDVNAEGAVRYNSGDKTLEFCNGTGWNVISSDMLTSVYDPDEDGIIAPAQLLIGKGGENVDYDIADVDIKDLGVTEYSQYGTGYSVAGSSYTLTLADIGENAAKIKATFSGEARGSRGFYTGCIGYRINAGSWVTIGCVGGISWGNCSLANVEIAVGDVVEFGVKCATWCGHGYGRYLKITMTHITGKVAVF
jgi:hypothetical protein